MSGGSAFYVGVYSVFYFFTKVTCYHFILLVLKLTHSGLKINSLAYKSVQLYADRTQYLALDAKCVKAVSDFLKITDIIWCQFSL